jgi:phospholipase/carboxylesterase
MLATVEVETGRNARAAVIWLHGLGADGHDFEPLVPELELPFAVRFVFPHAPVRPVTINGGLATRAWYDLLALGRAGPEDAPGIRASATAVAELIDREEARGIASQRLVLAGFSQGGAIALFTALRETRPLAGVLALSTYLPLAETLATERAAANRGTPIWMAHGSADPVIPLALAAASYDGLTSLGYDVTFKAYDMGHSLCAAEIRDFRVWLKGRLQGARRG